MNVHSHEITAKSGAFRRKTMTGQSEPVFAGRVYVDFEPVVPKAVHTSTTPP